MSSANPVKESTMYHKLMILGGNLMLILATYSGGTLDVSAQDKTLDFLGAVQDDGSGYIDYVQMGCWQCHGFQGQGGEDGPQLAPNPMPIAAFENLVRRPANVMPAYSPAILTDERIKRIYAYLQTIPPGPDVSSIPLLSGD